MNTKKKTWWPLVLPPVFLAAAVAVAYFLGPTPSSPQGLLQKAGISTSLPSLHDGKGVDNAYQALTKRRPWGGGKEKNQTKQDQVDKWQLRGVVKVSQQYFALIETGNNVRRYLVGDTLPNGEKIQAIQENSIEVEGGAGTRVIRLYHE